MSCRRLIVLKLGGSVLLDEHRLRLAVHEIYRWRREGWRVVAVVSALAGRTDELLARCRSTADDLSGHAVAAVLSTGERESASLLGVHLDRVGIPARVLAPGAVGLVAAGDPLNADPLTVRTGPFQAALEEAGVVVFPGFVAVDAQGRPVTLGRGGSDLTALFLAHHLDADACRLVKDVDGLYSADPATSPDSARRFACIRYDDALRLDGTILQHKAVRFAKRCGLAFEVGRFNGVAPTRVGGGESVADESPPRFRQVREVTVIGVGTVGGGVVDLLRQLPEHFRLVGACCRHPERLAELAAAGVSVTDAPVAAARRGDIVVELIGGVADALAVARLVLADGRVLVTANKALLADHGPELRALARRNGGSLHGSASVGGGLPVIESVAAAPITAVRGVLNGTGNYVLEQVRLGLGFDQAVARAQVEGFAETDPSRDLDGRDSLDKLAVLSQVARLVDADARHRLSSTAIDAATAMSDDPRTRRRHVAVLDAGGARVRVEDVIEGDPLYDLPGEGKACVIERADGRREVLRGRGAGRWPTAESVLADLLELARRGAPVGREVALA